MFPFYNQQPISFYQQMMTGNQYWMNFGYQSAQNLNNLVQYPQNTYLNQSVNSETLKPIANTPTSFTPPESQTETIKVFSCKCINTDCRKQYCICFKNGEICGEKCGCSNCRNKQSNQRKLPLQKKRNVGCNCKKSQCAKKYCECYANGIKCGQGCHCSSCKNC